MRATDDEYKKIGKSREREGGIREGVRRKDEREVLKGNPGRPPRSS